jgi:hypothetical protein
MVGRLEAAIRAVSVIRGLISQTENKPRMTLIGTDTKACPPAHFSSGRESKEKATIF